MEESPASEANGKRRRKTKIITSCGSDRLSTLPESVLHHICSFLDMKEVVQTSFLSRKWRHLWKSVTVLNFDYSLWKESSKRSENLRPYVKKSYNKDDCMVFVDRVFLFRDFSSSILKLRLSHNYCCDSNRLDSWLHFAASRHVKQLHLGICDDDARYVLPHFLFASSSDIDVLKLEPLMSRALVHIPNSICSAPRLTTLELYMTILPKGDINGELVFTCPILENLMLDHCNHHHLKILHVSALLLKKLIVRYGGKSCQLKLSTPNLMVLHLCGDPYNTYSLGNMPNASSIAEVGNPGKTCTQSGASHYKAGDGSKPMLRCLRLTELPSGSSIQRLAQILNCTHCVDILVLEVSTHLYREKAVEDSVKELLLPYTFCNQIRRVKLVNLKCHKTELALLAVLLENASVLELEDITITYTMWTSKNKERELAEFRENLHSFSKASSGININFVLGASSA